LRKVLWFIIGVPVAILVIVFALANGTHVRVSLDPLGGDNPAFGFTAPVYGLLFGALIVGIVFGGIATWIGQARHRREAREWHFEADRWKREADRLREAATAPGTGSAVALADRRGDRAA